MFLFQGNMYLADHNYNILHLLRPRTDINKNIRLATYERFPIDSCRKFPDCLSDPKDDSTIVKIENHILPLLDTVIEPSMKDPNCILPKFASIIKILSAEFGKCLLRLFILFWAFLNYFMYF